MNTLYLFKKSVPNKKNKTKPWNTKPTAEGIFRNNCASSAPKYVNAISKEDKIIPKGFNLPKNATIIAVKP